MASIRKLATGKWRAEIMIKGVRSSKSFDTKRDAQKWAMTKETESGRHGAVISGFTLRDAMKRFAEEVSPTRKGCTKEVIRLNSLAKSGIASIALANLQREDLQTWIASQKISGASINRYLNLIGTVLKYCRTDWKYMTHNPMTDLRRPKDSPPRERRIAPTEEAKILEALEYAEGAPVTTQRQIIAVAWLISIETALRQGELWGLEWQRVHLEKRYVMLPDTKNGSKRDVPLTSRAVELFTMLNPKAQGMVITHPQESCAQIFRRAVEMAGVENMTWHDARHEAITRLARKLDIMDLARMVGHRDIRSLRTYYNPTAEEIAKRLG